jgi:flagellar hook protein FlgE
MVQTSLFTGLSGLRTHQTFIDVIGNNLANVSTPGYWSSRATFSDILSFTVSPGSGPNGNFGGRNPKQIGLGASVASIDLNTRQGTFQDTGRAMDIAIQGQGFFALTDGQQSFYTRVGTFGIDSNRNLVDVRTGFRVMNSSGGNITVPVTDTLPPRMTSSVTFQGNLPAKVSGPLEEIVESENPFLEGTAATKTSAPAAGTTYDVSGFVGRDLLVSVNGGAKQTVNFAASAFGNAAAATAAEIAALFGSVTGLTVTPDGTTGQVRFETKKLGSSSSLKFDDGAGATGLLAALGLNATQVSGSQSAATAATDLANLTGRTAAYANGDQIIVSGTNPNGSPVSNTFVYGAANDGTTLGDLLTFINATFDSTAATATLQADGRLRITATAKEPADLSLFLGDAKGNTGSSTYPNFKEIQAGQGPDQATSSIDVIDNLGRTHSVTFKFTRSVADPNVWDMVASMDPADGTLGNDTISTIRFNSDGSFNVIGGGTNALTFDFNGISSTQTVTVNLGTSGQFDGVALLGNQTTVAATDQDGHAAGTLLNVAFDASGTLQGYYTNGQSKTIDTLRVAMFPNEEGLLRQGNTLFVQSPNSDDAIVTTAGSGGAGVLRPGSLENSNVDIAEEFVSLITAQRGFQANSRVITTTDEILAELVNIVR